MNMILFTVNILIALLLAEQKSVFRSDAVLENENDPNRQTIYGEFIVFFDLQCVTTKQVTGTDIIQDFVDLFQCYTLNVNVEDLFPNTIDHWIYMDEIEDCDQDDIEIEWDDYCIIGVEEDEEVQFFGSNQCVSRDVESALWNLNTVCPTRSDGIEYMNFDSSYNPNLDIIVMDSGIDASHPQFNGISIERIFDAYPDQGLGSHGTHCAGTILGKDYGAFRINSDTQIKVIDVRIFPLSGGCSSTTILNAYDSIINYLDNNPGKKVIINMSFGGGNWAEYDTRLSSIKSKGGISIAAAGNDNIDASEKSPASSIDTITVGANDKNNNKAWFSNYGNKVDIWAPGTSIKSAVVGGGSESWDGTSMATPLVAGIAANILANNPGLDFENIKQILLNFAKNDVNDGRGNTNLPRVQASCDEYSFTLTFTLKPSNDESRCLDVDRSVDNVITWECHGGDNQKWKKGTPDSDGYYTIKSVSNDECLDVDRNSNGIVDSGDNIITWPCHGFDNQRWKIDGKTIRVKQNGGNWCLGIDDNSNNVNIEKCDDQNGNRILEFPDISSLIGSITSIFGAKASDDNMLKYKDDFEVKNNYNDYKYSEDFENKNNYNNYKYNQEPISSGISLLQVIGVLLLMNIICFTIYFCKRFTNNTPSKKQYKVVQFELDTDLENPDQ